MERCFKAIRQFEMEATMRSILAIAACAALSLAAGTQRSHAEVTYPWCAEYSMQGSSNCGFATLAQCQAALSGNGGYCSANPMFRGTQEFTPVRRSR